MDLELKASLLTRVKRGLARLPGGVPGRIGVAVSGGADSLCLLLLLREVAEVAVLHLNHSLRGAESDGDEAFVRGLAERFAVPVHVQRVDVRALGGNMEEAARRARYEFFQAVIDAGDVGGVATGHTLSDQAETVMFRVLRGAHLAGLAAIHPLAAGPVVRPMLDVSRAEVEAYLRSCGQQWREDSSNADLGLDRNRIRRELMTELKREWNPEIERSLGQMAALAFDEERFWAGWMEVHAGEFLDFRGNIVLASASKLAEQPVAVGRRLVRRAIGRVRGDLHAIEFGHVEAILKMAAQQEGSGRLQIPQVDVYRSFDWMRWAPLAHGDQLAARNQQCACTVPGSMVLPEVSVRVDLEVIEMKDACGLAGASVESGRVKGYELDWDQVLGWGSELSLRTWKPGDEYSRVGESRAKVKTMFQEGRIPLWERGTWPIITVASKIIWSREFGPAAEVAAHGATRRVLKIRDWRNPEK